MRKLLGVVLAVALVGGISSTSLGLERVLEGTKATLYEAATSMPGSPTVSVPYRKSVRLHKLKVGESAYWNPHSSKYIIDGGYAYLWCVLYKANSLNPSHHWIAVTTPSLNQAQNMSHKFSGGVAYYQLKYDGSKIAFIAYPYSTLHAIMEGKKIVDVKE